MKMTAPDLQRLGIVDEVVPEAPGGAHRDFDLTAGNLGAALRRHLAELRALTPERLVDLRYDKFRQMGAFVESGDSEPVGRAP
jgi:acetyl-CoA carboxylase carboxyl transferase subunit alpha